jgi:ribosomal protein S18 acetylase RimI-like enzyme
VRLGRVLGAGLAPVSEARLIMSVMAEYTIRALSPDTWSAFAALVEKHNGVWGGCWCTWFHRESADKGSGADGNRVLKQRLVRAAGAHAALVYDGQVAVGWCQYGTPEELPNIYHRKQVEAEDYDPPDYRLTCLFVDRDYRRRGVAAAAVRGALDLIAQAGGGVVEAYPQDTQGSASGLLRESPPEATEHMGPAYRDSRPRYPERSAPCFVGRTVPHQQAERWQADEGFRQPRQRLAARDHGRSRLGKYSD